MTALKLGGEVVIWAARVSSVALCGFFVVFFVGEISHGGIPRRWPFRGKENVMMLAIVIMMLGILLSWKMELAGVVTTGAGYAIWCGCERKLVRNSIYFMAFPLISVLFLTGWIMLHAAI